MQGGEVEVDVCFWRDWNGCVAVGEGLCGVIGWRWGWGVAGEGWDGAVEAEGLELDGGSVVSGCDVLG